MIINPWIFYLIDVLVELEFLFGLASLIFMLVTILFSIAWWDEKKTYAIWLKASIIATLVCSLITSAIPSKETMYTMLVSSYVTTDNIETATDVIKDSVDYIFEKFNEGEE